MRQIRVLIADDSSVARLMLNSILSTDNEIKVVGEAVNGKEAVEKAKELKPDIVTMDIGMPVMDGLEAIELIMAEHAVPIIVITEKGIANYAFAAISKGALEIIPKADVNMERPSELVSKLKLLSKVKVITHVSGDKRNKKGAQKVDSRRENLDRVVAIASSTGGPKALSAILPELPKKFPYPVVIAQHMANGFICGLVEWLNGVSKIPVREGADGEMIRGGTVYISPSEKHMKINSGRRISLIEKKPSDIYHPSCNILLSSAADSFGADSIGVILTGMGDDGALGMKKIKDASGVTIAQDENTSAIFGMPKVAIESGCIDKVLPISEIGGEIVRAASR